MTTLIEKITTAKAITYDYLKWCFSGFLSPPPGIHKQRIVKKYAKKYKLMTLIETGTYKGEMIEATKSIFDRIVSIEIDRELYLNATKKFAEYPNIKIIEGDSGIVLSSLLRSIDNNCLFWLDGHYSGEGTSKSDINTPIIKELTGIFENYSGRYVILIDDSRCFDGTSDYPNIDVIKKNGHGEKPEIRG